MKKNWFWVILIISVLTAFSCRTTKVTDDTFKKIYDKYANQLILDGAREYTVKSGEILAQISWSLYNNGYYFPVIMLASNNVVLDPDKIAPGMRLTVPDLQRNLNDRKARSAIKNVILDCAEIEKIRERKETAKGMKDLADDL